MLLKKKKKKRKMSLKFSDKISKGIVIVKKLWIKFHLYTHKVQALENKSASAQFTLKHRTLFQGLNI